MSARIHYTHCPVCDSSNIDPLFTTKDFSVSGEEFVIWQCAGCSLRFTQDVPDEDEIGPYYKSPDYISHTNTAKGVINKMYQKVRNYTLQQKADLIARQTGKTKGSLLDVGCGTGAFLHVMKQSGWEVTGIEPDADARALAARLYGLNPLPPQAFDALSPSSFDVITLWHVLEHVHRLQDYMQKLKTLLQASGKLFIAVPNYESLDAAVYRLYWAAYDVPRHLYHFSPRAMDVLMKRNGLRVVAKKPMWFDSFYISLLSSKYRKGKVNYLSAIINGVRSNLTAAFNRDRCSSIVYIVDKA